MSGTEKNVYVRKERKCNKAINKKENRETIESKEMRNT
jgi:hypothetical protein